jgi:hypothetical protein
MLSSALVPDAISLDEAFAHCEARVKAHYENFPVGLFVPKDKRRYVHALYAFARAADDFADEPMYEGMRREKLDQWEARLHTAYEGEAQDPVFMALGETVRRLTSDHGHDDIYARNMWWSADETRYLHRTNSVPGKADNWDVINAATGDLTHTGVPFGSFAADGGCDPVDPNVLYYLIDNRGDGRGEIHRVTLNAGGTWTDVVYFTAPGIIDGLGGSINWLDAAGRYMLVRYGAEPSVHVYDRQNLAAGPYANSIDGSNSIDQGAYLGLSPDGKFVVGYDGRAVGFARAGQGLSWRLDHATRTVAPAPNVFWSLCGDHGSFLSASDGRNYMITYDCYSQAGLWRVDITNNAEGLDETRQQSLPNNKLLLAHATWNDFGHVSTVARGTLRDWAFTATEDTTDTTRVTAAAVCDSATDSAWQSGQRRSPKCPPTGSTSFWHNSPTAPTTASIPSCSMTRSSPRLATSSTNLAPRSASVFFRSTGTSGRTSTIRNMTACANRSPACSPSSAGSISSSATSSIMSGGSDHEHHHHDANDIDSLAAGKGRDIVAGGVRQVQDICRGVRNLGSGHVFSMRMVQPAAVHLSSGHESRRVLVGAGKER